MVKDKMFFSNINIKDIIESDYRLEASVYNIEAINAKEIIKKSKYPLLALAGKFGFADAYVGNRFKRIFVEKSLYPIFQPSQITDVYPKPNLYVSHKTNTNLDFLKVKKSQLLLTCSGTVGNCTLVTKKLQDSIFSHDLIRIDSKELRDVGFLYTFIKSNIGQLLLKTNNYGAVIQHIEPEHLENILIPNPPEELKEIIHNKINESFNLRDESNDLIDKAEKLLINELQLPPIEELHPEYYDNKVNLKNFAVQSNQLNNRFDGSFHTPIVLALIDSMLDNSLKIVNLGNSTISKYIILPTRFKRTYVEESNGRKFLGGKDIFQLNPDCGKYLSLKKYNRKIQDELIISKNNLIFPSRGTVKNIIMAPDYFEGWAISDNLIKLIPADDNLIGYVYIFLNSEYGKILINRMVYGSVVDALETSQLSQVPIPILKNIEIQNEINNLALRANELRSKAYFLEQEAIEIFNKDVLKIKSN